MALTQFYCPTFNDYNDHVLHSIATASGDRLNIYYNLRHSISYIEFFCKASIKGLLRRTAPVIHKLVFAPIPLRLNRLTLPHQSETYSAYLSGSPAATPWAARTKSSAYWSHHNLRRGRVQVGRRHFNQLVAMKRFFVIGESDRLSLVQYELFCCDHKLHFSGPILSLDWD